MSLSINTDTSPTLSGPWQTAARVLWFVIIAIVLVTLAVTLPAYVRSAGAGVYSPASALFGILDVSSLPPRTLAIISLGAIIPTGLVYLVVSALIFWSSSHNRIALLVSLWLAAFGPFTFLSGWPSVQALGMPPVFTLSAMMITGAAWAGLFVVFFLFPDGRFTPRWAIGAFILSMLYVSAWSLPGTSPLYTLNWPTPLYVAGQFIIGVPVIVQVVRYRYYASPRQRQQMKWVIVGLVGFAITFVPTFLVEALGNVAQANGNSVLPYATVALGLFSLSLFWVPLSFAMALLRDNLWDVNIVINRGLVYAGVTGVVGVVLVGGFLAMRALLTGVFGIEQDVLAAVLPAVAATALFNPTRRALRRFVDRRIYGIAVDYTAHDHIHAHFARDTGTTLGRYTRLELLGAGGMGRVYRAEDQHRTVALKVLAEQFNEDQEVQRRFLREGQALTRIEHPNIVQLYRAEEIDGRLVLAMEYIAGEDLSAIIKARGAVPFSEAQPWIAAVGDALEAIHAQGIIHRDIKPSNVMIEAGTNRAVLMDFGIAKLVGAQTQLTLTGMMGTLDYAAPEQIQGAADVDARADIYAFGVMTYQLLTGRLPFNKATPGALVLAHLMEPPPDPRKHNEALSAQACAAVLRALAKKPAERYASVAAFVEDLSA